MARLHKPKFEFHRLRLVEAGAGNHYPHELVLVGSGRRSYLWVRVVSGDHSYMGSFSGPKTLRALAKAILAEVGDGE